MRRIIMVSVVSLLLISNLGITGVFALVDWPDTKAYEAAVSAVEETDVSYSDSPASGFSTVDPSSPAGMAVWAVKSANESWTDNSGPTVVYVSEKIPWADCQCYVWWNMAADWMWPPTPIVGWEVCPSSVPITERKYKCTINPWLWNFQAMFADIIRYLINIVLLLWVLAIAWLGVAWAWAAGDDAKAKSALKKWWVNIVAWLIILFLFQYILHFIAPWIYQ